MSLSVRFSFRGLTPSDVAGRVVFVVDVLRATTTICAALHNGARAVIPADSAADAIRLAQTIGKDDVVLAGERQCQRIDGFALGNSPLDMTREAVGGRTVVLTTTNGTKAMLATEPADEVYIAAAANITEVGKRAKAAIDEDRDVLILCAGRDEEFGLDDAYTAGRLAVLALAGRDADEVERDDATIAVLDLVARYRDKWEKPLRASAAGQQLWRLGFGGDIAAAAKSDGYPVLAHYHERRVLAVRPAA